MNTPETSPHPTTNPPRAYFSSAEGQPSKSSAVTDWLQENSLPVEIEQILTANGIDEPQLLSHCQQNEIDTLCQLMVDDLGDHVINMGTQAKTFRFPSRPQKKGTRRSKKRKRGARRLIKQEKVRDIHFPFLPSVNQ